MLAQAQDAAADADAGEEETTETVIVTGTRASGVDAFTSSSPIQVLSAEAHREPPAGRIS